MPTSISRARCVSVQAVQDVKGTIVSTAMNKTVVVAVEQIAPHPTFFKRVRKTRRIFAHTETSELGVGDYVRLEGCRPLSKNKRFEVAEVIRKSQ
jgi:small subunit ribosomal protein S17